MWEVKKRSIISKTGTKISKTGTKQVLKSVKQVLNSVKHSINEVKTQSNGRVNLIYSINQPWDPETGCVPTPLGSPTGVSN